MSGFFFQVVNLVFKTRGSGDNPPAFLSLHLHCLSDPGIFKRLAYLAQPWGQAREVIANLTSPPSGQGATLLPEETLCEPGRGREINHAKIKLYQLVSKRMHLI